MEACISEQLADTLVQTMGQDSGCRFVATDAQELRLRRAVTTCRAGGLEFTDGEIRDIVGGEVTEWQGRFGRIPGWAQLTAVLDEIFDGPNVCAHLVVDTESNSCFHCKEQMQWTTG